jgi:hypothetical protein
MRFAVMVRDAVNAMGRPSGIKAIATDTQSTIKVGTLIHPGCSFRRYAALKQSVPFFHAGLEPYQTIMIRMIMVNMMEQMTITKLRTSLSKVVMPVLGALVIFAIFPKTVESPVETTTPMPLPETQWVPCRPTHLVSR